MSQDLLVVLAGRRPPTMSLFLRIPMILVQVWILMPAVRQRRLSLDRFVRVVPRQSEQSELSR